MRKIMLSWINDYAPNYAKVKWLFFFLHQLNKYSYTVFDITFERNVHVLVFWKPGNMIEVTTVFDHAKIHLAQVFKGCLGIQFLKI